MTTKKAKTPKQRKGDLSSAKRGVRASRPSREKLSALDAAARVLAKSANPLSARELITAMANKGLWTSPAGKTPHATLYAAIFREIKTKGRASRFAKAERGRFAFVS